MEKKSFSVVRETFVNIPKSLLTIPKGGNISISCADFAPMPSVRSAACRLNQRSGFEEFHVSSPDNGATINIFRCNAK